MDNSEYQRLDEERYRLSAALVTAHLALKETQEAGAYYASGLVAGFDVSARRARWNAVLQSSPTDLAEQREARVRAKALLDAASVLDIAAALADRDRAAAEAATLRAVACRLRAMADEAENASAPRR